MALRRKKTAPTRSKKVDLEEGGEDASATVSFTIYGQVKGLLLFFKEDRLEERNCLSWNFARQKRGGKGEQPFAFSHWERGGRVLPGEKKGMLAESTTKIIGKKKIRK